LLRELVINKLRKFYAVIFTISKAKFIRIAALLSKILTQLNEKRAIKMRWLLVTKFLVRQVENIPLVIRFWIWLNQDDFKNHPDFHKFLI